jgi:ribonuclease HI
MTIYLDSEYVLKSAGEIYMVRHLGLISTISAFTTYLPVWRTAGKTSYENKELVDRIDRLLKQRSVPCQV